MNAPLTGLIALGFTPGETVGAYAKSGWLQSELPPSGAPKGSAVASGVLASDGSVTLTGLASDTDYFLHGATSGKYVSMRSDKSPKLTGIGDGDLVGFYAPAIAGQEGDIRAGSAAAPVTTVGPILKVSRIGAVTKAAVESFAGVGNHGPDILGAIMGLSHGTAAEEVQGVGVVGMADTASTAGLAGWHDALGVHGAGRALAGAAGSVGIGGFFLGRRDDSNGAATGIEGNSANYAGVAGVLAAAGPSDTKAVWLTASGNADSAAGIQFGNPSGFQFKAGIHFNAQVAGGKTGPIRTDGYSIRDESNSDTVLSIANGTHNYALSVDQTGGRVGVGENPGTGNRVLIRASADAQTPLIVKAFSAGQSAGLFIAQDSSGNPVFTLGAGGALTLKDGGNVIPGTVTGTKIGTATTQKIAFWNATPIVQPSGTPVAATDLASAITLANFMRTKLLALGLIA